MISTHIHIKSSIIKALSGFCILLGLISCVEEIELNTKNFESLIVIEASITNEVKQQEVYISRTFRLEEDSPSKESNATVVLLADGSPFVNFFEIEPGRYVSSTAFAAQANVVYTLSVQTQDGRNYISSSSELPETGEIQDITVQTSEDSFGNPGVSILTNSSSNSGNGNYYKFEYEETYKIIAPFWRSDNLFPIADSCDFTIDLREKEERICYNTVNSIDIILSNTIGQPLGQLTDFEARFIEADNTIIAHRYSILLKQFVIPEEAYRYFEKRRELSIQDNLFSQAQPGFLEGNITSVESPNDERVIGIFYVATVDKERFFFNWTDVYPDQEPPEIPCGVFAPALTKMDGNCLLKESVTANTVRYWGENLDPTMNEGPYDVVTRVCGDCTARGSNIVPEFWEE